MQIFLSWSGRPSQKIADELFNWLPKVLQNIKPFFSSESIRKGKRWLKDITESLENCNAGIIVITRDNLNESWVNFEAGALSKIESVSTICTLLIGLQPDQVSGPLSMFQATVFEKTDFKKLVISLNSLLPDDKRIGEVNLNDIFEKWWPELESKVQSISTNEKENQKQKSVEPKSDPETNEVFKRARFLLNMVLHETITNNLNERLYEFKIFLLENEEAIHDTAIAEYFKKWLAPLSTFDLHGGIDTSWDKKYDDLKKDTISIKKLFQDHVGEAAEVALNPVEIEILKYIGNSKWKGFHSTDVANSLKKKELEIFYNLELLEEKELLISEHFDNGNVAFFLTKEGRKYIIENKLL